METVTRKKVVFVLGGPGSGKGTQCSRIAEDFAYTHLSTGELLRQEQECESDLAKEIDECIREGRLVPSSTMVSLLKKAIMQRSAERFLIDGFPRSRDNLNAWFQAFTDEQVQVEFVLFLHCPKDELKQRLLERGKTSGRADDNLESVLKRFDTFESESLPVVEDLDRFGVVRRVSTIPQKDLVYQRVKRLFRGRQLVGPTERTLALIKPDAAGNMDDIIKRVEQEGFVVVAKYGRQTWTAQRAEEFYREHLGRPFFNDLINFMCSGPLVQLCLEKVDAIKSWRKLAGPTDVEEAKSTEPCSLRALFGTDCTKNAVHGSDSYASAFREVNLCFGRAPSVSSSGTCGSDEEASPPGFLAEERTLALLKPSIAERKADDVLSAIAFRGFRLVKASTQTMQRKHIQDFFQDSIGKDWFPDLCKAMAEGKTTALCLARVAAVATWRALMGSACCGEEIDEGTPCGLTAALDCGRDPSTDGLYGSASVDDARRGLAFWFPELSREATDLIIEHPYAGDPKYDDMMSYLTEKVEPIVSPLLQRILQVRPDDVAEFMTEHLHGHGA